MGLWFSDLKITSLIFKSPDPNPLDYHVWGAMPGRIRTRQNRPALPSWRLLLSISNDLLQEFTVNPVISENFDRMLLQLADALNTHI